jgi:hypothetical protein
MVQPKIRSRRYRCWRSCRAVRQTSAILLATVCSYWLCVSIMSVSIYHPISSLFKTSLSSNDFPSRALVRSPTTTSLANVTTAVAYYSPLADDRSGSVIEVMIRFFGYSYINRGTYMGACGSTTYMDNHKTLMKAIGLDEILPFACPPGRLPKLFGRDQHDDIDMKDVDIDNPNDAKLHFMFLWESRHATLVQEAIRNQWTELDPHIAYLKRHVLRLPPSDVPLISVHIRRGDISPCCGRFRYLPNVYYDYLIEKHLKELPNARVVVFSEEKTFEPLDIFVEKGYELEAGGDLGNCWKTMISSDVLIVSTSGFSRVPQILMRGKVGNDPSNFDGDETLQRLVEEKRRQLESQCKSDGSCY